MVTGGENFLFCQGTLDLISLNHFLFAQNCPLISKRPQPYRRFWGTFHSVQSTRLLLSDQVDFAHIAFANQFDLVKTARSDLNIPDFDRVGAVCFSKLFGVYSM